MHTREGYKVERVLGVADCARIYFGQQLPFTQELAGFYLRVSPGTRYRKAARQGTALS
jgi:hypothetical protein